MSWNLTGACSLKYVLRLLRSQINAVTIENGWSKLANHISYLFLMRIKKWYSECWEFRRMLRKENGEPISLFTNRKAVIFEVEDEVCFLWNTGELDILEITDYEIWVEIWKFFTTARDPCGILLLHIRSSFTLGSFYSS